MNRPIKFRAWDGEKMKFWNFLDTSDVMRFGDGQWELEKLMQFTGLLDKNGKEIYEGDVVHFIIDDTKHEVTFEDSAFRLGLNLLAQLRMDTHEVIGNIYENSDLLV